MKRIAMILVLSLVLQLISPAIVTEAALQNAQEEETVFQKPAGETVSMADVTKGDASEGDASKGDASEGDASEGDVSEGDASKGDVSEGDVSQGDASAALMQTEYTQAEGFFQDRYYGGKDGYLLFAGVFLENQVSSIQAVRYQIDDEEIITVGDLDSSTFFCTSYTPYFATLSLAKSPARTSEGMHRITIWFQADGVSYQVSSQAEFIDKYNTKEVYDRCFYSENRTPSTNYIYNQKGTRIENILLDFSSYHKGETLTDIQLVQSENGKTVKTKLENVVYESWDILGFDYSYQTYCKKNGSYYWLFTSILPKEAYSMEAYGGNGADTLTLTLQEDIPAGFYDVVATTSQNRTYRIEKMYEAFEKPVVFDVNVEDGTKFKPRYEYGYDKERVTNGNLFYADNTGNYLTLFVYGSGISQSLVPSFYSEEGGLLATYDPKDSGCGYVYGSQWGSYFRLKKTQQGLQFTKEMQENPDNYVKCYTKIGDQVVYANEEGKASQYYYYQDVLFHEILAEGDLGKGSKKRGRLYFGELASLKKGDRVSLVLKNYGKADYQEICNVGENETGRYIELTQEGIEKYQSYSKAEIYKDGVKIANAMPDAKWYFPENIKVLTELQVPAGATWAFYSMKDVVHPVLSGTNSTEGSQNVLDAGNCAVLGKYGTVRVCISKGEEILTRQLLYVPEGATYTITYHMGGGVNSQQNPTSYRAGETITLYDPQVTVGGMQFDGFYLDAGYKTRVEEIKATMKGNLDLYAKWVSETYQISFDPNVPEGTTVSGKMPSMKAAFYAEYALKKNTYKTAGYLFDGWSLEPQEVNGSVDFRDQEAVYNLADPDSNHDRNVTLYAVWRSEYQIRYHINLQEYVYLSSQKYPTWYTYGKNQFQIAQPRADGYAFDGWYQDEKLSKKITAITKKTYGDLDLYAKWKANTYSIRYDGNGSTSGRMPSQKGIYGQETTLAANKFVKNGYAFVGWSFEPDAQKLYSESETVPKEVIPVENNGVLTVYARWEPRDYSISYHMDGGFFQKTDVPYTYAYGEAAELPGVEEIVRGGFTFDGWYLDPLYKKRITKITEKTAGDLQLYAKWTANVTVVFHSGLPEGEYTGSMKRQTAKYGVTKAISANAFKPADKTLAFAGWALVPYEDETEQKEVLYQNKEKISYREHLQDQGGIWELHLYAVWKSKFTVNYYVDGSSYLVSDYTYGKGIPAGSMAKPEDKTGYRFAGWYADPGFKKKVTSIGAKQTGDLKLYAKYTGKTYTITFYPNHEAIRTKAKTQKLSYGTAKALTKNAFKVKGYTFKGWSLSPDGPVYYPDKALTDGTGTSAADGRLSLYAVWEKDSYSITYRNISEEQAAWYVARYSVDSKNITLTEPERIGYTFMGWYSDPQMKKPVREIKTGSTGNKTLYAKWKLNCEIR